MCQMTEPLSFNGVRSCLLCFDFLPQLEHLFAHPIERGGWWLAI